MGTLVNNNMTPAHISLDFEKETNSEQLETNELELPTSGDSACARCFERAYVSDDTNETIGLRGIPGL